MRLRKLGRGASAAEERPFTWIQVLNYRGLHCLDLCLDSLQAAELPPGRVRFVVVDNDSCDGSAEMVRNRYPEFDLIESGGNLGYVGGNNLGLRKALRAGADYAVLVNMDATVAPDCLVKLVMAAEETPRAALVGSTICTEDGERIEFDGRQFDPVLTAGGYADTVRDQEFQEGVRPAAYACGAGMLARLEALEEIGLFSESLFAYHEDVELSLRARLFGHDVVIVPDAFMFHARGGAGAGTRFRDFMGTRNMLLTLSKVYDRATWLENSAELMDFFLGGAYPQRSQTLLAALFEAPVALRQRRRLRSQARRTYSQILDELRSFV